MNKKCVVKKETYLCGAMFGPGVNCNQNVKRENRLREQTVFSFSFAKGIFLTETSPLRHK